SAIAADAATWRFLESLVFADKKNLPPQDYLRQLRFLSRKTINKMEIELGHKDTTGSNHSHYENDMLAPPSHLHTMLEKNPLDLPVDENTGKVRDDIRVKFLQKFGVFAGKSDQLAAAVKAVAIEHIK